MQRDVIRCCINFLELGHANALLFGDGSGDKGVVRHYLDTKGAGASSHLHADTSEADNTQSLAAQLSSLEGLLVPLAGMHERVGPTDMPRHCKHQTEGVLGDGHGIGAWGVHDRDTLASRGVEIDVVHSHSRATDHA